VLEVADLSKSFGALRAVHRLSFTAEPGRITSIIGPNGAGKSTVFNLVSGTLRPDAGRVRVDGRDVTGLPPHEVSRLGVARSFQISNLFFGLSAHENLRLACQALEQRRAFLTRLDRFRKPAECATALLDEFDLAEAAATPVAHLAHGDQRRLEIAICMASRPKLLLLDEPTQGMSPGETAAIDRLIKGLAGRVTILLIEHDIELVMGLSDKIVVLHQGEKLAEGPPETVRASAAVQDAYLGRDVDAA
jgi:branched-chain amino acid transport system ATP-binding protein